MSQDKPLNAGQTAAADLVMGFLLGPEKEMCISGPGGSGKTHLMGHLIDSVIPTVQTTAKMLGSPFTIDTVEMTATTNKAAEVLGDATKRPSSTIQSYMGFVVKSDYNTGQVNLVRGKKWAAKHDTVVFVDEGYCADSQLRNMVLDSLIGSKVIWVGDHCQLGPVKESHSPLTKNQITTAYLTESMRNKNQPALQALCAQLRNSVETGDFYPIKEVPGVIDFVDNDSFPNELAQYFHDPAMCGDRKIMAYQNEKVLMYCDYLRQLRGLPSHFTQGEILINNSAVIRNGAMLSVEEEVEIIRISDTVQDEYINATEFIQVRRADLKTKWSGTMMDVPIPVNMKHFNELRAWFKRQKNWAAFFKMNEQYPDLRMREASTTHKAQGSTYHTAYVDLDDLSQCHNPLTAARLLYVALSRASERVVLYGDLAQKYGGLIRA